MMTTSRYACAQTRKLARAMAAESGCLYIARGKKTIDSLADYARKIGEDEIIIIEERGRKPALAITIKVDERGRWSWKEERLLNPTEKELHEGQG